VPATGGQQDGAPGVVEDDRARGQKPEAGPTAEAAGGVGARAVAGR